MLQGNRVAIVRFASVEVRGGQRVEAADQVPGGEYIRSRVDEIMVRIQAGEVHLAAFSRLDEGAEIPVEVRGVVGFIHRAPVQLAVGVVHGDIEERAADEGGQPGHGFAPLGIKAFPFVL